MRRDEAAARAREEAREQRQQEEDSARRLAILRGESPPPPPRSPSIEEEAPGGRAAGAGGVRRKRKRAGEDDTDFEMRVAREQQEARQALELYKNYKPDVNIVYYDEFGRELTPKEAWKALSHKFHGKGSGRMKTEKRLKKIAEEKKKEARLRHT